MAAGLALSQDLFHLFIQFVQPLEEVFVAGLELQKGIDVRGSFFHEAGLPEAGESRGSLTASVRRWTKVQPSCGVGLK